MPARQLIDSGEVDRVAADIRQCRDHGYSRDCQGYAIDRLAARHPTETRAALQSVYEHAYNATSQGNYANQTANRNTPATYPGTDPADTQYRGGNRSAIRYRYGVQVQVHIDTGPHAGSSFPLMVYVSDRQPLSAGEIRDSAVAQAEQIADQFLRDYERFSNSDISVTADTRITSAYRDRA